MNEFLKSKMGDCVYVSYKFDMEPSEFKNLISLVESPLEFISEFNRGEFKLKHKEYRDYLTSAPVDKKPSIFLEAFAESLNFKPTYELDFQWDFDSSNNMDANRIFVNFLNEQNVNYFTLVENEEPTKAYLACSNIEGKFNPCQYPRFFEL